MRHPVTDWTGETALSTLITQRSRTEPGPHSALSSQTVVQVLRQLRNEDDPLVDLVSLRRLARADRYHLRISARHAKSVRWRRRRPGHIDAIHPAFPIVGGTAGLAYQALGQGEERAAEVARMAAARTGYGHCRNKVRREASARTLERQEA